jgi:hypothetical protein
MFSIDKRGTMKKEVINILCLLFGFSICFAQVRQDSYSTYNTAVYGSAIQASALTNYRIDLKKVSFKFRAKHRGAISGIRVYIMGPGHSGYGAGTGGTWRISLRHDSAANHMPSHVYMTSLTHQLSDDGASGSTGGFPLLTFNYPASVDSGTLYHIVFENIDADPDNNYSSVNTLTMFPRKAIHPEQVFAADLDWNSLYSDFPYTTWSSAPGNYTRTPIMEYYCTDGYSTGMGYSEVWISNPKSISGRSAVRETFIVTGTNRSVAAVEVYMRKKSGTGKLVITLSKTDGTLLEQDLISAASISTDYSWVNVIFSAIKTLNIGQSYNLTFSADSATDYEVYAIWKGSLYFTKNAFFSDGFAQFSTGMNWTGWDRWGRINQTDGDLMFYFKSM